MTHRHSEYPKNPEQGAYCVYWIPQIPMPPFRRSVSSLDEAVKLLETLAFYDTFQFEMNVKGDYSNAGGLEIFGNCIFDSPNDPGYISTCQVGNGHTNKEIENVRR